MHACIHACHTVAAAAGLAAHLRWTAPSHIAATAVPPCHPKQPDPHSRCWEPDTVRRPCAWRGGLHAPASAATPLTAHAVCCAATLRHAGCCGAELRRGDEGVKGDG